MTDSDAVLCGLVRAAVVPEGKQMTGAMGEAPAESAVGYALNVIEAEFRQ